MAVNKMWLLDCGQLWVDRSTILYRTGMGEKLKIPVSAALVETTDGYLLFDTGLNPDAVDKREEVLGHKAPIIADISPADDIRNRLEEVGVKVSDVRWVLNSHLHWDHTGGNKFFPNAEFILQKEEWRFARDPDQFVTEVYLQSQFDLNRQYTLLDGSTEITEGVAVINTRGHTPGHQSLVVNLPDRGYVVYAGDALYCPESLEELRPPGNAWNMREAYRSLTELKFWQTHLGADIIIGHEPDLWKSYTGQEAFR